MTRQTAPRRPRLSAAAAPLLAALALLALPAAARAQWATNGNDVSNTNTGSVGVGTVAPARKLDVAVTTWGGNQGIGVTNTNGRRWWLASADSLGDASNSFGVPANGFGIVDGTSLLTRFVIGGTGNVGVGTNSPAARLHVVGAIRSNYSDTATYPAIRGEFKHLGNGGGLSVVAQGTNSTTWGSGDINFVTSTSDSADGFTDAPTATRMTIRYNGRVGIGTTSPAHRLDVQGGAVNASGGLCIAGDCKTSWSQVGGASQWAASGSSVYYSAGNVGVGTASPSRKLEVVGDVNGLSFEAGSGSPHSGVIRFGDNTGWKFHFGRSRDSAGGALNTGAAGVLMTIQDDGRVGIGKANPAEALDVVGNISATGSISAKYQDVAEWVPTTQRLQAGTVVVLDTGRTNHVLASGREYDTSVAGVVSAQPGLILGEGGEGKVMVATTGRVKVRVDATRAPVKVGDLLVTSGAEGVAMKSIPVDLGGTPIHRPGTIIGKALEPLEKGVGEILVLLSLQ